MDTFLAIEKILHFHHTTSRQPLRVNQVRLRAFKNGTAVSMKDIEIIKAIYPEAYRIWNLKGNLVMDALDLPHNAEIRREIFCARWQDKENLLVKSSHENNDCETKCPLQPIDTNETNCSNNSLTKKTHALFAPPQRKSNRILMGRLAPTVRNTKLTLLERIREKEALLNCTNTTPNIQASREKFLRSQIPKLKRILDELVIQKNGLSLEMNQVMELLRTNLFKLGDSEIKQVLHLLMETYPQFCSIVTVGETTHVKLCPSVTV